MDESFTSSGGGKNECIGILGARWQQFEPSMFSLLLFLLVAGGVQESIACAKEIYCA